MSRFWVVARFEFLSNIRRWEFLILTLGLPIFSMLIMVLVLFPNMVYLQHKFSNAQPVPVGYIDETGLFHFPDTVTSDPLPDRGTSDPLNAPPQTGPATFTFRRLTDVEGAKRELLDQRIQFLYVIHADYIQSGAIDTYTVSHGLMANPRIPPVRTLLQKDLLQNKVDAQLLKRVTEPVAGKTITLSTDGSVISDPLQQVASEFLLPYGMMILLLMSLLGSSSYLLRSLSEEKENRIMEILLAAVSPAALFYGKILGLGLLGLVQLVFWLILTLPVLGVVISYLHVAPIAFLFFLLYFSLGYMLFAGLIAGVGAIGSTEKESNQILGIFFFLAVLPMTVMPIILDDLNGTVSRIFSMIPFTAPMVMMVRFVKGTPPTTDIVLSILCMALGIWLVYRIALKVFRMGLLMYGKTPSLREIAAMLKAS